MHWARRSAWRSALLSSHPTSSPISLAPSQTCRTALVEERLLRLLDAEVLMRTRSVSGSVDYTFRHALLQQAATDLLLAADRRALHVRAAAILAALRPSLIEQQPEAFAEHHVLGEEFAAAVPLFARAARRALAAAALEEAESQVRRGLGALSRLPRD